MPVASSNCSIFSIVDEGLRWCDLVDPCKFNNITISILHLKQQAAALLEDVIFVCRPNIIATFVPIRQG